MSYYYLGTSTPPAHVTLPFNVFTESREKRKNTCVVCGLHNHIPLEIVSVLRGELHVPLDGREYLLKDGETVLANPFVLHSCTWGKKCTDGEYIVMTVSMRKLLQYPGSVLSECAEELTETRSQFDEYYPVGHPIAKYVRTILHLYHEKSPTNEARTLATVFEMFGFLLENHYHPASDVHNYKRDVSFLRSVTAFISENYAKDITTADIASALFMETSQFCRVFRRHFGTSFSNHLCKYRIEQAATLYRNTDLPASGIAKLVGFRSYNYFSRSFKRYTCETPARYFGKWK